MIDLILTGEVKETNDLLSISDKNIDLSLNKYYGIDKLYPLTDNRKYYLPDNKMINNTLQSKIIYRNYRKDLNKKSIGIKTLLFHCIFGNISF